MIPNWAWKVGTAVGAVIGLGVSVLNHAQKKEIERLNHELEAERRYLQILRSAGDEPGLEDTKEVVVGH